MKKGISLLLAILMVLGAMPLLGIAAANEDGMEAAAADSPFYLELVDKYTDPPFDFGTEVRWWMGEGSHTDETLIEEITAMHDAGFTGVELCLLNESSLDAAEYGYGTAQWKHTVQLSIDTALDFGMKVGLTSGTNWGTANIPGLDPDSEEAMQHVVTGKAYVEPGAGFSAVVPRPTNFDTRKSELIGVYAYEVTTRSVPYQGVVESRDLTTERTIRDLTQDVDFINADNIIDLTPYITGDVGVDDLLTWNNNTSARHVICAYWKQGTYQQSQPAEPAAYCINYFDKTGVDALIEYWTDNVLDNPELAAKIKANPGRVQLFMDSLEFTLTNYWTTEIAEEFLQRKGYDIRPYLCLLDGQPMQHNVDPVPRDYGNYDIEGNQDLRQRIRNDLMDVHTELYMENMLEPWKEWLNEQGIALRAQISYGRFLEISEPIMYVDYPETEAYNMHDQVDMYRVTTGGSKLQNKVVSTETGALNSYNYMWLTQEYLQTAYIQFGAGISRMNWHIWSATYGPGNGAWPGYEGGMSGFSKLGTREPAYSEYKELNKHFARVQQLLREGKSRSDVGMVYLKYGQPTPYWNNATFMTDHEPINFPSTILQDNGYTFDYFSPTFLTDVEKSGVYFDEEAGTLELAGYKALVLWQDWLPLDAAETILDLAKDGLKVVVVDGAAVRTPYTPFNDGQDDELAAVMEELKGLDTVRTAATAEDSLEALQNLEVTPYAAFAEENYQLLTQVRQDGDNMYLYVYNYCPDTWCDKDHGNNIQTEISMDGLLTPYSIDAWSGEVVELAEYRYENGDTVIPIDLDYGDIALFAFEPAEEEKLHIVYTDADSARVTENGLVISVTKTGLYDAVLSNGSSYASFIEVPTPYDITDWELNVESWTAGSRAYRTQNRFGMDVTESAVETVKTQLPTVELQNLTTWDEIPSIGKTVVGKGYYSATFTWDGSADGAYLDLGEYENSLQVFINGEKTADVNMNVSVVDISELLTVGENEIEIVYSSTLGNLLRGSNIDSWSAAQGTPGYVTNKWWRGYDLYYRSFGPSQAVIVPYVEQEISANQAGDGLALSTDAYDVKAGDYANITTEFVETINSNTAIINYYYDTELFEQRDFHPANGVDVISRETTDYGAKVMVMVQSYNTQTYGMLALQAKPDAELTTGWETVKAHVEYVVLDESGEKEIKTTTASTAFKVRGEGPGPIPPVIGDTNGDGIVDLIDLSNMIDWFGIDSSDPEWKDWYTFFDFNDNGSIDIYDIVTVAQLIK